MPTYDYKCKCGATDTRRVDYERADSQQCSVCGGKLKRLSHFQSLAVQIPLGWGDFVGNPFAPTYEESARMNGDYLDAKQP